MTTAAPATRQQREMTGFVPVSVKTLIALHDVYVHADIFLLHDGSSKPTLFRSRKVASTADDFHSLADLDVLYIKRSDFSGFQSAIAANMESILQRDDIPPA